MISYDEIKKQSFNFEITFDEVHKLKYMFNIVDREPENDLLFMNLVKFKEGGCIRAISNSTSVMLDINIPMKRDSTSLCNLWCTYTKKIKFHHLHVIRNLCGPWTNEVRYDHFGNRQVHQIAINLQNAQIVEFDFVLGLIQKIMFANFASINTGWSIYDFEMLECMHFSHLMTTLDQYVHPDLLVIINNGIRAFKLKKIIKEIYKRKAFDLWVHHYYSPDNPRGFVKKFRNYHLT